MCFALITNSKQFKQSQEKLKPEAGGNILCSAMQRSQIDHQNGQQQEIVRRSAEGATDTLLFWCQYAALPCQVFETRYIKQRARANKSNGLC